MEDWDVDRKSEPVAFWPVRSVRVMVLSGVLLLLVVVAGAVLRAGRPASPFAAQAAPAGAPRPGRTTSVDPAVKRAADLLLGSGDLYAGDPNALGLSAGQTAVLRNRDTEVEVTPGQISGGTGGCAAGPLLTVAVSVRVTQGSVELAPGSFTWLGRDGSAAPAVEACSTGFAESAPDRTLVFATAQPGRLAYGPDPDHPIAMWSL